MPALIIKPTATSGNKLILQDQAGGAVLTTADSGATYANATLTAPTIASMANCTFPAGHVIQVVNTRQSSTTHNASSKTVIEQAITLASTSNDVLIHVNGQVRKDSTGTGGHLRGYLCGGSLGSTTSGYQTMAQHGYGNNGDLEQCVSYSLIDTTPGSTTVTYSFYIDAISSATFTHRIQITVMELQG